MLIAVRQFVREYWKEIFVLLFPFISAYFIIPEVYFGSPPPSGSIIIVGGGAAGMVTALELASLNHDLNIIIFDKQDKVGGNSAKASSGINGIHTRAQSIHDIDDSVDLFFEDVMKSGKQLADENLVQTLVDYSEDAIRFLESHGVNLDELSQCGGHQRPRTHRAQANPDAKFQANIGYTITSALEKAIQLRPNIRVVPNTQVTELYYDEKIKGVIVNDTLMFVGPVVILASGGFGRDERLLKEFAPKVSHLPSTNGNWTTGDGIHISRQVNAQLTLMSEVQVHPTGIIDPKQPTSSNKFLAAEALRAVGGILVNAKGERFVDELGLRDKLTDAIFNQNDTYHDQHYAFLLLNQLAIDTFGAKLMSFYQHKGLLQKFATAKEFATAFDVPYDSLAETFAAYNKAANSQEKTDSFGKTRFPVVFNVEEPLFAFLVTPSIHYTMGGVKINRKAQVLSNDNNPIPGLYAAGEVTGGVHGRNRLAGNSLLECVVFGRIAARSVADYCHNNPNCKYELPHYLQEEEANNEL